MSALTTYEFETEDGYVEATYDAEGRVVSWVRRRWRFEAPARAEEIEPMAERKTA